jgi:hypothetical protein
MKQIPQLKSSSSSNDLAKTGKQQAGSRNTRGQFVPGVSGNPAGRPEGSRNRATLALQELMQSEGESVVQKALQMAFKAMRPC